MYAIYVRSLYVEYVLLYASGLEFTYVRALIDSGENSDLSSSRTPGNAIFNRVHVYKHLNSRGRFCPRR